MNKSFLNHLRFEPEVLAYIFSKSLFIWIFETIIQKGFFYFLNYGSPNFMELLCYTGYKFVNLSIIVIVQLLFGYLASYIAFFLTSIMYFVFFYKTMSRFMTGSTLMEHTSMNLSSMNRKSFFLANSVA